VDWCRLGTTENVSVLAANGLGNASWAHVEDAEPDTIGHWHSVALRQVVQSPADFFIDGRPIQVCKGMAWGAKRPNIDSIIWGA
jgi:hypothetical protein